VGQRSAHIVLGSDVTPASRCMLSLIRSTDRDRYVSVSDAPADLHDDKILNLVQHPLGTQDFIGRHSAFTEAVRLGMTGTFDHFRFPMGSQRSGGLCPSRDYRRIKIHPCEQRDRVLTGHGWRSLMNG
jgi:hypothetical protein